MRPGDRRRRGNAAEDLAARYLERQGFQILERNFTTRVGEIDLIAREGEVLVFVEVRSLSPEMAFHPVTTLTPRKLSHLKRAMELYLYRRGLVGQVPVRLDVVTVIWSRPPRIEHLRDAYRW